MNTTKKWVQKSDSVSQLFVNDLPVATIDRKTRNAKIKEANFTISSSGFFSQKISITDSKSVAVLELAPKHWYSHKYSFQFNNEMYELTVKNNPLAEVVIKKGDIECLAYGLDKAKEDNKIALRIHEKGEQPLVLHILLWYLFEPVARENIADFLLLIA